MKNNKQTKNRGLTEINLTSLVDVCLTLVIIFMVSYPLVMQSGINIKTPSVQKAKMVADATELKAEINLKQHDALELNGTTITPEALVDSLKTLLAASENKMVVISAEDDVVYDRVVAVLDLAKQCGAQQLSIVKLKE